MPRQAADEDEVRQAPPACMHLGLADVQVGEDGVGPRRGADVGLFSGTSSLVRMGAFGSHKRYPRPRKERERDWSPWRRAAFWGKKTRYLDIKLCGYPPGHVPLRGYIEANKRVARSRQDGRRRGREGRKETVEQERSRTGPPASRGGRREEHEICMDCTTYAHERD